MYFKLKGKVMDLKLEAAIIKNALRLKELDNLFVKTFFIERNREHSGKLLLEFEELKKSIKIELMDHPIVKINNKNAQEIIKNIYSDEFFEVDKFNKKFEKITGERLLEEELNYEEISDLADDLFLSWYSHYDYIVNLYDIKSLILGISVPKYLDEFVDEARKCYAFEQYNAVYSLSRTILEICIRDICEKKGFIRKNKDNIVHFEKYNINELIRQVSRKALKDKIWDIYHIKLSSLIHGRKTVTSTDAKEIFVETLKTIEELYKVHGY